MSAPTKRCSRCGKDKPRSEFYVAHKATATRQAKLRTMCKECDNTRQRSVNANQPRINRQRARNRAIADLIKFHEDEFATLYEIRLAEATDEAEALAQSEQAREHYKDEPVRLRPGQRRQGQKAGDRIDVARCPHCIKHHDRGHRCTVCGARPGTQPPAAQPPQQLPRARRTTTVDPAALAEFNAGTQRAAKASRR